MGPPRGSSSKLHTRRVGQMGVWLAWDALIGTKYRAQTEVDWSCYEKDPNKGVKKWIRDKLEILAGRLAVGV